MPRAYKMTEHPRSVQQNIRNPPLNALRRKPRNVERQYDHKLVQALILLVLAASYHSAIRLNLVPVYGQVAAKTSLLTIILICSAAFTALRQSIIGLTFELDNALKWLPLHVIGMPTFLDVFMFGWSSWMGNRYAQPLTEICACIGTTMFAFLAVAELASARSDGVRWRTTARHLAWMCAAGILYTRLDAMFTSIWPMLFRLSSVITRASLLLYIGCIYAFCFRSKLLYRIIPVLLFTLFLNPHMPWPLTTKWLNYKIYTSGYLLLERQESVTGYVSVLENTRDQFRVMRCDHSLLGGEWLATPERVQDGIVKPETIYSAFTILEAVRLIEIADAEHDELDDQSALVIGLGIGTSPKALTAHGIDTKVVELDPAVIEFSRKYFALPDNVTTVNQDAVDFAKAAVQDETTKYDYIIHDVFTGGSEPAELFTLEFLNNLRALMKPNGTIAINYTADLALKSTAIVMKTIKKAFGSCRAFRDSHPAEAAASEDTDFVNLVVFCTKHTTDWKFRQPVEADFLQSMSRRQNLPPRFEVLWEQLLPSRGLDQVRVLREGKEWILREYSEKSALGHWEIMRKVLPDKVWINW